MRRFLFLWVVSLLFLGSCKSDSKASTSEGRNIDTETVNEYNTISGEFIYSDSVAVFKKEEGIYGVIMDARAKDLITQAREINSDPFASFEVTLVADIKDNPEKDAWPQVITIQNIIKVEPSSSDDSLRLNK